MGDSPAATGSAMTGFDAEFRDLDEYIRVITARIWEGRRIDDIRAYYSDPCVVETPSSVSTSVEDVISGTRATLQQFPDRRLLAEDIIQSGDAERGFLSSHRIISTMTHQGDGNFGRASGTKIHVRTIADCVCKDNRIIHEWLVRDQAAIALHSAGFWSGALHQKVGKSRLLQPRLPHMCRTSALNLTPWPMVKIYVRLLRVLANPLPPMMMPSTTSGRGDRRALVKPRWQHIGANYSVRLR
jgi:hypothetical protein